eukprot:TRINITY_DN6313_c0_g1_i2.p1 TRINITY_DN6313_c0_g1~~TRINITY_DN6313_c0_g1_i2.p1  ORF type:complete len:296 (+),score=74.76 TRINITY_DN6313_c0_g1_i2:219-1106(+)
MSPKEVGCVAECLVCRSHVVVKVAMLDATCFEERIGYAKPAERQQEWMDELQERVAERKYCSMPCPYCVQVVTGHEWDAFTRGGDECLLCPMKYVIYEEGEDPPIYVNRAAHEGGKPKWTLMQGVGPQSLELDKSRSGKVYKKSYRGSGLRGGFLQSVEISVHDGKADLPPQTTCQNLLDSLVDVYWKAGDNALSYLESLEHNFGPLLLDATSVLSELSTIKMDPYEGLATYLEAYPPPKEHIEIEEEAPASVKTKKTKHNKPPPSCRENRPRGEKREASRRLMQEMKGELRDLQ